jgi:hypothetical protein
VKKENEKEFSRKNGTERLRRENKEREEGKMIKN